MKQTAVEWLIEQIESKGNAWENQSIRKLQISIDVSDYLDLKRQALQMEKEQIVEAFKHGELPELFVNLNAEQYYEQTYKTE